MASRISRNRSSFSQRLYERYSLKKEIGRGAFSRVYLAKDLETFEQVAIKVIDKKKMAKHGLCIEDEVRMLKTACHENVIALLNTIEDETHFFMVLEYIRGGELYDRLEKGEFTEKGARNVMTQLLEAVSYLHSVGIVHRDLKPENVLFCDKKENSRIIVTDFGIAATPGNDLMTAPSGTLGYAAPEVVNRQPYDAKVDSWSLGVIAYILLVGYPPMNFENNEELLKSSQLGYYKFEAPFWDGVSAEAKDFVSSLMNPDASKRLTCKQALRHPWIQGRKMLSQNQVASLKSKLRAAFLAVRWMVRTQKASAAKKTDSTCNNQCREEENKASLETIVVPHPTKRLSTNGSIPEKFKEELAEKASISEMSISLDDETYAYLLAGDDEEDSGVLVA